MGPGFRRDADLIKAHGGKAGNSVSANSPCPPFAEPHCRIVAKKKIAFYQVALSGDWLMR
jgi:hypothetical protein